MFNDGNPFSPDPNDTESEFETVDEKCDCDPAYKETAVIQESMGMNLGMFGGEVGLGDTVVICKNCHKLFAVEDTRQQK